MSSKAQERGSGIKPFYAERTAGSMKLPRRLRRAASLFYVGSLLSERKSATCSLC